MSTKKPTPVTLRLPADMHEAATKAAEEADRSLNNFIVQAVRNELKRGDWLDQNVDDGK